jgi:hypothetical protein
VSTLLPFDRALHREWRAAAMAIARWNVTRGQRDMARYNVETARRWNRKLVHALQAVRS